MLCALFYKNNYKFAFWNPNFTPTIPNYGIKRCPESGIPKYITTIKDREFEVNLCLHEMCCAIFMKIIASLTFGTQIPPQPCQIMVLNDALSPGLPNIFPQLNVGPCN